jgi:hypothetical protein
MSRSENKCLDISPSATEYDTPTRPGEPPMTYTIEISDELKTRLDSHLEEDESYEEFITELVSMYETGGTFLQEGYSE